MFGSESLTTAAKEILFSLKSFKPKIQTNKSYASLESRDITKFSYKSDSETVGLLDGEEKAKPNYPKAEPKGIRKHYETITNKWKTLFPSKQAKNYLVFLQKNRL
jgi:hypothetical protein